MPPSVAGLLLKPAGPDCNLNCEYCFYSAKKALFPVASACRMEPETARRAISEYLEIAGPAAAVCFQGGEPLLRGIGFYGEILPWARRAAGPGRRLALSVQTNGLLLDERWAALFRENGVLAGLSIDGPAEVHDACRKDFAGGPAHARAAEAMALLIRERTEFNTLSVVTGRSVRRGGELYAYFAEKGGGHMQFIPCLPAGGERGALLVPPPEDYGVFLIMVFDRWYNGGEPQTYVRLFDEMLVSFMEYRTPSCAFMPSCPASLVVEHDGSVYPCDFFVEPGWKLGTIGGRPLREIAENPLLGRFCALKGERDPACRDCRWLPLCFGGCPAYRASPGAPGRDRNCEGLKRFFAHAQPRLLEMKRKLLRSGHPRSARWRAAEAALGRNAPCPCGSGTKFKKCCMDLKKP